MSLIINEIMHGDLDHAANLVSENDLDHIELRAAIARCMREIVALRPPGKPGLGSCICKMSPEDREKQCQLQGSSWEKDASSRFPSSALVNHRCPKHGEKAQPDLWGRHKELELVVSHKEWVSLGRTYG